MEENEIMVTDVENQEAEDCNVESSGNGFKAVGILALTAAVGTGLFFGAKKIIKKVKDKVESKRIKSDISEESDPEDEE